MKVRWIFIFLVVVTVCFRFIPYTYPKHEIFSPAVHCLPKSTPLIDKDGFKIVNPGPSCETLKKINQDYLRDVKRIFEAKCLMCHADSGGQTHPLYVVIPPVTSLIKNDIREARKKMEMSFDFPFQGHGAPKDDLEKISKVIRSGKMPPLKYKVLHWQSGLTAQEKKVVLEWVQKSQDQLLQDSKKEII